MTLPGETDLAAMLRTISVSKRPDPVTMVSVAEPVGVGGGVLAELIEAEGVTVVATVAEAQRRGWATDFVAHWLTVDVHSSLEAVGLTAAMSAVLTTHGIPCNVLAGFHHDHLLVPVEHTQAALDALHSLRDT